jgi:hypothetical protein
MLEKVSLRGPKMEMVVPWWMAARLFYERGASVQALASQLGRSRYEIQWAIDHGGRWKSDQLHDLSDQRSAA